MLYASVEQQLFDSYSGTIDSGGIGNVIGFYPTSFKSQMLSTTTNAELYRSEALTSIKVTGQGNFYWVSVYDSRDGSWHATTSQSIPAMQVAYWGIRTASSTSIQQGDDFITLTPHYVMTPVTKQITKLYCSVPIQERVYSGIIREGSEDYFASFDANVFSSNPAIQSLPAPVDYLRSKFDVSDGANLVAHLTDNSSETLVSYDGSGTALAAFGVTLTADRPMDVMKYIDLSSSVQTLHKSKLINLLYGSVSGETKLLYGTPSNSLGESN